MSENPFNEEYIRGLKDGRKHVAPSPETEKRLGELERSVAELKKTVEKGFKEMRKDVEPVLDAYKSATISGRFVVWFAQFLLAVGLLGGAVTFILRGMGKW